MPPFTALQYSSAPTRPFPLGCCLTSSKQPREALGRAPFHLSSWCPFFCVGDTEQALYGWGHTHERLSSGRLFHHPFPSITLPVGSTRWPPAALQRQPSSSYLENNLEAENASDTSTSPGSSPSGNSRAMSRGKGCSWSIPLSFLASTSTAGSGQPFPRRASARLPRMHGCPHVQMGFHRSRFCRQQEQVLFLVGIRSRCF